MQERGPGGGGGASFLGRCVRGGLGRHFIFSLPPSCYFSTEREEEGSVSGEGCLLLIFFSERRILCWGKGWSLASFFSLSRGG